MLGQLYDLALDGEPCWIVDDQGTVAPLPVGRWLGEDDDDMAFDAAVVAMCECPTIELGCGPARLITDLTRRGVPALGVDQSATAIKLARRRGAPVIHGDVFGRLPAEGRWGTVLLTDGNVGLGGDPRRLLTRAATLLRHGGHCLAELDPSATGIRVSRVRLETDHSTGEWFRWASVGVECAAELAEHARLTLTGIHRIGERVIASLAAVS